MMTMLRTTVASAIAATGLLIAATPAFAQAELQPETSDVARGEAPKGDWFYVNGGWGGGGTAIFDSQTGKMKGSVDTGRGGDLAIDPAGRYYYVSETIWSRGNRGTRQDMVTVYDTIDFKRQTEIKIPGRIIIGARKNNFVVSDDGRWGFVYNLDPASSVNIVDLSARKFYANVELAGCASLMPNPGVGFSALCSDGSLATVNVTGKKPAIARTAPFFQATDDPIFDNYAYDLAKKQAVFLTYTGLIYTATISAQPTVAQPFSIQVAAGLRAGDTKPLDINWIPGGRQPMAYHKPSGHLYVLMHMGEMWTHKEGGTEIWDVDVAAKKVVKRIPLKSEASNIGVTQTATPLLFVNGEERKGLVIDPATGETKHEIENSGGGVITTVTPF